jgi:hypothetical protein
MAIVVAAALLGACANESNFPTATGTASLRALNAIPGSPSFTFSIEERTIGNVNYKSVTNTTDWDDLEYTFNFWVILAGDFSLSRVASQILDVERDRDYTFVISGALDAPDITIWDLPLVEWIETETIFEANMSHTAVSLGDIDVYLADAAIPPVLGNQIATLARGELAAPANLEEGDYVLTITPAGDDSTFLFISRPVTIGAQNQIIISVFDGDENDLSNIAVRLFNQGSGGTGALIDARFPPTMRFFHASLNFGDADIYIDDPLTVPVVTNHMFGDITSFIDVTAGNLPITYTAPGNTGSILMDVEAVVFAGARTDFYVARDTTDTDVRIVDVADRRSILTRARLSVINTAAGRDAVDFYIVRAGTLLDDAFPVLPSLPLAISPVQLPLFANDFEIYVTDVGEKIPLAGPIPFTAALGDVFETIIYENVDPNVVDFVFIPAP